MHSVKKPIKKRINNSSMGVKLSKRILLDTKVEPQIIMHTKAKICPIIVLFFMPNNYNKKVKGSVKKMKKLDPVVIIVDVLLLIGCGCMFLYGKMSAHSLFIVGLVLIAILVVYLYVTNYKDNHYGGRFHKDF